MFFTFKTVGTDVVLQRQFLGGQLVICGSRRLWSEKKRETDLI